MTMTASRPRKNSPRRLDAAKKLLADMGRRDEAVLLGDGRVRLCRNLRGAGRRRHGTLRPAARGPRLRAHENAEGVPGDRLPRNHPLARLSRVGCSPDERDVALLAKSPIRQGKTPHGRSSCPPAPGRRLPEAPRPIRRLAGSGSSATGVGGMRCAIIETIDCPENKELPRSPCNAAKARCRNGSRKADRARG